MSPIDYFFSFLLGANTAPSGQDLIIAEQRKRIRELENERLGHLDEIIGLGKMLRTTNEIAVARQERCEALQARCEEYAIALDRISAAAGVKGTHLPKVVEAVQSMSDENERFIERFLAIARAASFKHNGLIAVEDLCEHIAGMRDRAEEMSA